MLHIILKYTTGNSQSIIYSGELYVYNVVEESKSQRLKLQSISFDFCGPLATNLQNTNFNKHRLCRTIINNTTSLRNQCDYKALKFCNKQIHELTMHDEPNLLILTPFQTPTPTTEPMQQSQRIDYNSGWHALHSVVSMRYQADRNRVNFPEIHHTTLRFILILPPLTQICSLYTTTA